jgi:hypothetical protein
MFVANAGKIPAPGAYNLALKEPQIKYSMRAKLQDHTDKWIKQVPGPGTYNAVDPINEECKNFVAKYETAPSAKFSILPRLVKDKLPLSPGPAQCIRSHYPRRHKQTRRSCSQISRLGDQQIPSVKTQRTDVGARPDDSRPWTVQLVFGVLALILKSTLRNHFF